MADPARLAALQALLKVEENAGYSNLVLDKELKSRALDSRSRALASTIFYGVLERRLTLDYYIAPCLRDPKRPLDPAAQEALRCGAYQIFYLDRIPDSAAVNETVECLKAIGKGKLAGFANGVLRGLLRKKGMLAPPQGDSPRAWAVRYSVPEPLIRLWMAAYGRSVTEKILEAFQERPELYIRANTLKTDPESLQAELKEQGVESTLLPEPYGAMVLESSGSPTSLAAFREGRFHVQDLSAQQVCALVDPQPGETVCDCCAAPGGKSFTLAQHMGGTGSVYALDLYKGRVGLISQGAQRLGLENITAQVHDALQGFDGFPTFDRVLCDVPCSGFGVIRRKPEIRYKSLDSIKELPALQLAILEKAAAAVKPGGRLVYSTCTLNPAENEGVTQKFLAAHPEFSSGPSDMHTLLPFSGGSDGFFAAVFQRK